MMLRYLLQRLVFHGMPVIFLVTVTVFIVTHVFTDPVRYMLPPTASQEDYVRLQKAMGLDAPLHEQFATFLSGALRGDFGDSYWMGVPAMDVVVERLPATLTLVALGSGIAFVIFVPLGILAALKQGSTVDRGLVTFSLLGVSMPEFWLGAMLIFLFSVGLGWFPTSGFGSWEHVILPAATLAIISGGRLALVARSAMLEQLSLPYVTVLKARGLAPTRILFGHVLRGTMVPIMSVGMLEFAANLAGAAVIVEAVFAWPGVGRLALQAVSERDIGLLQAVVFVCAAIVVVVNLLTDVAYRLIDPRIELG